MVLRAVTSRLDYAPGEAPDFIVEGREVRVHIIMLKANVPYQVAARLAFWAWLAQRRGDRKER